MHFPDTNKHPSLLSEEFGDNAKLLEENVRKVDWRVLVKAYFFALGLVLVTVFAFIVTIRGAIAIF